jgi:hypothetical protein
LIRIDDNDDLEMVLTPEKIILSPKQIQKDEKQK